MVSQRILKRRRKRRSERLLEMTSMRKFHCEKCGNLPHILVDGYGCGDRLLEGVMFKVWITDEGEVEVQVTDDSAEYFEKLDVDHWLKEIRNYVEEHEDKDIGECPFLCHVEPHFST